MSLAQKAGKAGALLLLRKMWGALVNIGVMAYLARTLDKSDFGLVAISGTLIGFIEVLGVSGIGEYIIFYNGNDQEKVQNAAFWLNIILTIFIIIVVLTIVPFWITLYKDPRILKIITFLLIGFFFSMLSSIPQAIFRKSMDYQPMVGIQTLFGTISQLSQVAFAFFGLGVFSLVLPNAIITPIMAVALLIRSGFRPDWKHIGRFYWKQIFGYTKHVIGARLLTKFANEGDTLLVGKFLGMEALGIYDIAFKLANIFNTQLLPIITNISLPVFAKNQRDIPVIRNHYLKMITLISFIFFPVFGFLILFAPSIIPLLYGHNWDAAILPFQILCIFAVFRSLSSPTSGLYNALGKPQIGLYFAIVFTPIFLTTLYFSSFYGLIWMCITVTFLRNLGSIFHFYMGNRLIDHGIFNFWKNIRAPLISTLLAITLIASIPQPLNLSFSLLFAIIFGSSMRLFFKSDLFQKISLINQLMPFKLFNPNK